MRVTSIPFLVYYISFLTGVDGAAKCGEPRCTGPLLPRMCGGSCTKVCEPTLLGAFNCLSTECGTGEQCLTFEGQQALVDSTTQGTLDDDPCCSIFSVLCFSSKSTVMVQEDGGNGVQTLLKDIEIGDKVLTGSGTYQTVYAVDHKQKEGEEKDAPFVQIFLSADSPLELTQSHMVFVNDKKHPIPASQIRVGDSIQTVDVDGSMSSSAVTKMSTVTRKGYYNIITTDGTLVVDGVVASSYSALFETGNGSGSEMITIAGYKLISHHDFMHMLMAPYRMISVNPITKSLYTSSKNNDWYTKYSQLGISILETGREQNTFFQSIIIIGLVFVFGLVNLLTENPFGGAIGSCCLAGGYYLHSKKNRNSKVS